MASAAYFRRQAEVCMKLAMAATEPEVANRLIAMAEDYKAKAEGRDREDALRDSSSRSAEKETRAPKGG